MTTPSDIFTGGTRTPVDTTDARARRAVKAFRALQPTLSAYARVLTGRSDVRVEASVRDNGSTDGKRIFYRPPIGLGDDTPHERRFCNKRNERKEMLCPACRLREFVLVVIYHEIAHIAWGSFAKVSEEDKARFVADAVRASGGRYAEEIARRLESAPDYVKESYIALASLVNEYLPLIVNALEDARVNREIFRARKGTKAMFVAHVTHTFEDGVEQVNECGETVTIKWAEYPLNAQVIVGTFVLASGYKFDDWFHPRVEEALKSPALVATVNKIASVRSVSAVYKLSFDVLECLRELGFCKLPEEEPDSPPEDSETSDDSEEGKDDSDTSEGESEDDEEKSDLGSGGDGGDTAETDREDSDSSDPHADDSDSSEPDDGEGDGGKDEGSSSDSSSDDEPSDDAASAGSSDAKTDVTDGSAGEVAGGGEDSAPDGEAAGGEPAAASDDSAGDGDPDDVLTGTGYISADSEPGDPEETTTTGADGGEAVEKLGDSTGSRERDGEDSSEDSRDEGSSSLGDSGMVDGAGEEPFGSSSTDSSDTAAADEAHDRTPGTGGNEDRPDTDDRSAHEDEEPIDTGADEGRGGIELIENHDNDDVPLGTPEDVRIALIKLGDHEDVPRAVIEGTPEEASAIQTAIIQGLYFETPSRDVVGVQEHRFDPSRISPGARGGWWDIDLYDSYTLSALGISGDFMPPESILGRALLRMRVAFAENARGRDQRNLRSGRVDGRVLGKRAFLDEPRLMRKRLLPGKRSYFVLIGIDISGSTAGRNIILAKRAALAQAELCARVGIKFAVYAHTGDYAEPEAGRMAGLTLDIYICKEPDEPWTPAVRRRIELLGPASANLDGHTLEYYRKVCDRQDATDKVIMYYSDGKMPAENHDEELDILKREIQVCRKKNYTLLGVGIRTDSPARHGLDTAQVDDDADIVRVVRHLERRLTTV